MVTALCNANEIAGLYRGSGLQLQQRCHRCEDGSVSSARVCETCSGETDGTGTAVDNDSDDDGVCDADEITGCTDPTACNYEQPHHRHDNTQCTYDRWRV